MPTNPNGVDRRRKRWDPDTLIEIGAAIAGKIEATNTSLTSCYRDLATVIVQLRGQFAHPKLEGLKDWKGQSPECREAVAKIYETAGIPSDSVSSIQSAIRYHIGNALREVAPAEALDKLGLDPRGPAERQNQRRASGVAAEQAPAEVAPVRDAKALGSNETTEQAIADFLTGQNASRLALAQQVRLLLERSSEFPVPAAETHDYTRYMREEMSALYLLIDQIAMYDRRGSARTMGEIMDRLRNAFARQSVTVTPDTLKAEAAAKVAAVKAA